LCPRLLLATGGQVDAARVQQRGDALSSRSAVEVVVVVLVGVLGNALPTSADVPEVFGEHVGPGLAVEIGGGGDHAVEVEEDRAVLPQVGQAQVGQVCACSAAPLPACRRLGLSLIHVPRVHAADSTFPATVCGRADFPFALPPAHPTAASPSPPPPRENGAGTPLWCVRPVVLLTGPVHGRWRESAAVLGDAVFSLELQTTCVQDRLGVTGRLLQTLEDQVL